MPWNVYRVVFRLRAPLHIGQGKINYLQRTRPYVTGRVFRGALVSRVGRNQPELVRDSPSRDPYRRISKTFAQYLTSTYFYPALKKGNDWEVHFPWEDEAGFRRRFLGSYAGTALQYPSQTAAEGQLREIEYLAPYTLDEGLLVYLVGYIFVEESRLKPDNPNYNWRVALSRLQLGGERGYGWGLVQKVSLERIEPNEKGLFQQEAGFNSDQNRPILRLKTGTPVWAHVQTKGATALTGSIEPLVGREWRADGRSKRKHIGQHLAYNGLCYLPGSQLTAETAFSIEEGGIWKQVHH